MLADEVVGEGFVGEGSEVLVLDGVEEGGGGLVGVGIGADEDCVGAGAYEGLVLGREALAAGDDTAEDDV